jgi:hypothetical protein
MMLLESFDYQLIDFSRIERRIMQTKRSLMSLTCTLAMVVNGASASAQGAAQEKGQIKIKKETGGEIVIDATPSVQVRSSLNWVANESGQGAQDGAGYTVTFEGAEFSFGSKAVKGAPYSADAITETSQTLSDGNRIVRHTASKIYRDGEGRERREQSLNAVGPWTAAGEQPQTIFINDPVSGINYILDPSKQTARKQTVNQVMVGQRVAMPSLNSPSNQAGGSGGGRGGAGGAAQAAAERATVEGAQALNMLADLVATPKIAVPGGTYTMSLSGKGHSEPLGKQMMEGVEAEGTRTTFTIPTGQIGNEREISVISERWYSPELQVVVMTKHSDPRTGENTYRLTNIVRGEPSPTLFQVPSDYKVEENTFRVVPTLRKKVPDSDR